MNTTIKALSSFLTVFEKASKGKSASVTFDDFLSLCICIFTKHPNTGLFYHKQEYSRIAAEYSKDNTFGDLVNLTSIFFRMIDEEDFHPDMLGDFCMYLIEGEENYVNRSTPFRLCSEMAALYSQEAIDPALVFDTALGTGRMLLAFATNCPVPIRHKHRYYGVDTNPHLVKLAAVNLRMFQLQGEVACAENYDPEKFKFSLKIRDTGVFLNKKQEESTLCILNQKVFSIMRKDHPQKRLLFL